MSANPHLAVAGAAVTVLLADQISKTAAVTFLRSTAHPGVGGISLRLVRNTGASFGLEASHGPLVMAVAIAMIAGVAVLAVRTQERTAAVAWGVTLGGALGNLADRLTRSPALGRGAVLDWIHVGGYPSTFNVADLAIRGGSVVALIKMALCVHPQPRAARLAPPPIRHHRRPPRRSSVLRQ